MNTRMSLPLIDVSQPLNLSAVSSLQQFGAFRLAAPQICQLHGDDVFSEASLNVEVTVIH